MGAVVCNASCPDLLGAAVVWRRRLLVAETNQQIFSFLWRVHSGRNTAGHSSCASKIAERVQCLCLGYRCTASYHLDSDFHDYLCLSSWPSALAILADVFPCGGGCQRGLADYTSWRKVGISSLGTSVERARERF